MTSEPLDLVVKLSGTYWGTPPRTKVSLNDTVIYDGAITETQDIKWSGELNEGNHKLVIEYYGKDKYQTIVEDGKIVKDQLLNIDAILFDDIDIGFLRHSLSKYYPSNKDAPEELTHCVNLGWNGKWELEFTTPIYVWLLKNI